ncbi:hypothetical protein AK812_SmicGene5134 [Symbiodinium microadriaticum]|uniref:Uncharacterized protein n=1 Tax=Symbiodinium microadriaticum TaxID=2951 RepID=A0A1Q9EUJ3_SYMMI|nr:hypothetical protein AK812_SmicGene5134 [Symbiodinium microadriaticum]
MGAATRIMQELSREPGCAAFAEVEVASGFVKEAERNKAPWLYDFSGGGRLQRAESCNKLAPHIWALVLVDVADKGKIWVSQANAVRATRLMHEKLTMQWRRGMAAAILKHADASKRVSYKKADETVRLVNEKLLRWKEEAEILQQEAREDEMARQELERQRMQAIQRGPREKYGFVETQYDADD